LIVVGLGADVKLFLPDPPPVSKCFIIHSSGPQVHDRQVRRNLPHGCGGVSLPDVQVVVDVVGWRGGEGLADPPLPGKQ
jgi:hypothetical protein